MVAAPPMIPDEKLEAESPATIAARPARPRSGGKSSASPELSAVSPAGASAVSSAEEAEAVGERGRLRALAGGMLLWCLTGAPMLAFVPGARSDKWIYGGGLAVVVLGYAILFVRAGRPRALGRAELMPIAWGIALGASAISLGAGICSPFTALMAIAVMIFALSAPLRDAVSVYAIVALAHALFGGLALAGLVTSSGLLDPVGQSHVFALGLSVAWVEVVYATALGLGAVGHRRFGRLLSDLERAVHSGKVRQNLLDEARAELDRAVKPGGAGYFTGQVLGGFRLAEMLGRGGMGEVYAADRTSDGAPAAVKLLRRDALSDPGVVHRFEREARIVSELRSPNIVEVYEVGGREAPFPFIAMERLRGVDLSTKLRHVEVLPLDAAITLASEVASGLAVAHAAGVLHRDLKPSNLFWAEDENAVGRWKVLDFGVSKLLGGGDTITVNEVVGTPMYMAPEQATNQRGYDHRVDVYSLAAILYRALTGRPLFMERDFTRQLIAAATVLPEDPRKRSVLPEEVALVLRIGLAKRPEARFESATELARAFEDAARGRLNPEITDRAHQLLAKLAWGARVPATPPPLPT